MRPLASRALLVALTADGRVVGSAGDSASAEAGPSRTASQQGGEGGTAHPVRVRTRTPGRRGPPTRFPCQVCTPTRYDASSGRTNERSSQPGVEQAGRAPVARVLGLVRVVGAGPDHRAAALQHQGRGGEGAADVVVGDVAEDAAQHEDVDGYDVQPGRDQPGVVGAHVHVEAERRRLARAASARSGSSSTSTADTGPPRWPARAACPGRRRRTGTAAPPDPSGRPAPRPARRGPRRAGATARTSGRRTRSYQRQSRPIPRLVVPNG